MKSFIVITALILAACSVKAPVEKPPLMYWPSPPERPRIQFIDYLSGSIDATGYRVGKFKNLLFGAEGEITFKKPSFVTTYKGVIYITDLNRIQVYDLKNKKFSMLGQNVLKNATGIAITSNGTLYVGDSSLHAIIIFKKGSKKAKIVSLGGAITSPGGIAVDEVRGKVYFVDTQQHVLNVMDLDGNNHRRIGFRGDEPGTFNYPYDVAVDSEGFVYVLDTGNFRVQILDQEGEYVREFGSVGQLAGQFARPKGISVDRDGFIYVVDSAFSNFQIFDNQGKIYLSVGMGGKDPGKFLLPFGIHVDEDYRIYVVDQMNKRVQIFQAFRYEDDIMPSPLSERQESW